MGIMLVESLPSKFWRIRRRYANISYWNGRYRHHPGWHQQWLSVLSLGTICLCCQCVWNIDCMGEKNLIPNATCFWQNNKSSPLELFKSERDPVGLGHSINKYIRFSLVCFDRSKCRYACGSRKSGHFFSVKYIESSQPRWHERTGCR